MREFGGEQKKLSHPSPVATRAGCRTSSTFTSKGQYVFITLSALIRPQKKRVVYGMAARHGKGLTSILHR
jgi:hypothetical protein